MSRAFVFPGQGAQTIGMGKALADAYPEARAVFDEVDEGTAIFKCDPNPPVSETEKFLSLSETSNDHYLRLVGEASRGIRGEIQVERKMPASISASRR